MITSGRLFPLYVAVALLFWNSSANAQNCPPGSLDVSVIASGSFDPSSRSDEVISVQIEPKPTFKDRDCLTRSRVRIEFNSPRKSALELGGEKLKLAIRRVAEMVPMPSGATLSTRAITKLVQGFPIKFEFATIKAGQLVPVGRYRNRIELLSESGLIGDAEITYDVLPTVRIVGRSASGREEIDFGVPEAGEAITTSVFYRSNSRVFAAASSENGGYMVHSNGPGFGRIPYRVSVDGRDVALLGANRIELPSSGNGSISASSIRFSIVEVPPLFAGEYFDVFKIELIAF